MIDSRQVIREYSDAIANIGFNSETGVEDYMALKSDVLALINIINDNQLSPQFGSGSPEGVVTSNINRTYFDTDGVNATMYINENIGADTGWKEVN